MLLIPCQDYGNIVSAAFFIGQGHEPVGAIVQPLGMPVYYPLDLLLCQHVGKAVSAKEEEIAA